jgi:hypothetical protein
MPAARPSSTATGGAADVLPKLLATCLMSALGWAVCLEFHLIPPDNGSFLLGGTICGPGAQDWTWRMGVGMALMCPPPMPPRALPTRTGAALAVLWVLVMLAAAMGARIAADLALDHIWLPRALGAGLLLASCLPAPASCGGGALLGLGCLRRCVGVMGVMLLAGRMGAPWMLGCAVLMRLDTLRPELALAPRAGMVAAMFLMLGLI